MRSLLLVTAAILAASPALAQQPKAAAQKPAERVLTYEDAVVCFQHYAVAHELARKLEKSAKPTADQAAGFELQAIEARELQAVWSVRIKEVSGKRSDAQISDDVRKFGAPVVADANAALAGDPKAAARGRERSLSCAVYAGVPAAPS